MIKKTFTVTTFNQRGTFFRFLICFVKLRKAYLKPLGNISYALPPEISLGTAVIVKTPCKKLRKWSFFHSTTQIGNFLLFFSTEPSTSGSSCQVFSINGVACNSSLNDSNLCIKNLYSLCLLIPYCLGTCPLTINSFFSSFWADAIGCPP